MFCCFAIEFRFQNNVLELGEEVKEILVFIENHAHVHGIASFLCNVRDGAKGPRRKHNLMVVDKGILVDTTVNITT